MLRLVLVLLTLCAGMTRPPVDELVWRGRAALTRGDHAEAIRLLEQAVEREPDQPRHHCLLARAFCLAGQQKRAEALLQTVLAKNPSHAEAGLTLARLLIERKAFAEVISVLQPLETNEQSYELVHLLAESHRSLNQLSQARRYYRQAVRLDPRSSVDYFQLGLIELAQGAHAQAIERFHRAGELGYSDPQLHFGLATAYHKLGCDLGSIRQDTVPKGQPGQFVRRTYLLEARGQGSDVFLVSPPESAVYQIQQALALGLGTPEARLLEADVWLGAKRFGRAVAAYESLRDEVPPGEASRFHRNFAEALRGADDMERYLRQVKKAVALDKADDGTMLAEAYLKVANRYNQRGDLQQYLRYLTMAIVESPETADLHYRLGNGLWEAGQQRAAARQWQETLELEPDHPDRVRMLELIGSVMDRTD